MKLEIPNIETTAKMNGIGTAKPASLTRCTGLYLRTFSSLNCFTPHQYISINFTLLFIIYVNDKYI